jgi:hypothetical protein
MTVCDFQTPIAGAPLTPSPSPARGEGRRLACGESLREVAPTLTLFAPRPLRERGWG